jgi:hypothetical protein
MKTVVIIYAVSWLILLIVYVISKFQDRKTKKKDDALEKFLNARKSTKEKIVDKLVYVIMIVFAPLVVFVVPYILIRDAKAKKQEKIRKEERENAEREQLEHKAVCSENYAKLVSLSNNNEFIQKAQSLFELVKKKDYGDILKLLDKASLPSAMKLDVLECNQQGTGSVSRLFVNTPNNERIFDIFDHLRFEDSIMGAWQAFLLNRLDHYLPLWWHANYNKRDYIYTKEDFDHITHFIDRGFDKSVLEEYNIAPEIKGGNGKYYISCCYWTDFGGLRREFVEISLIDNKLKGAFVFDEKVIHKYECGIMF